MFCEAKCACLQWLRWRQGVRLHGVALGLTIAGQGKLAKRVLSGWKVGIDCLYKGLHL